MLLEVIAKNLDDAILINQSNASRIELCKDLEVGGLTPDYKVIQEVTNNSKLPVNVIVRPTDRDFFYTQEERQLMLEQIDFIKTTKANGIVIGVLTPDYSVDIDFIKEVINRKGHLQITFHKAFDLVKDFKKEYQTLNELKINNVLTSGGLDINKGIEVLKQLKEMNLKTNILIGGGVTINNIDTLKLISDHIHIGTAARTDKTWNGTIDLEKIKEILGE